MNEPRIQYTRTTDGVNLAYWTLGDGPPLISTPSIPWSNIQLEWLTPLSRPWFRSLASQRTLLRYDGRGTGLSDRRPDDVSLEAHVRDLEAMAERLNQPTVELLGVLHSGPVAVAYAARHPERVSRLVLWCTYARGADYVRYSPQLAATRVLMDKDWEMYTETMAHATWGWAAGVQARQFASFIRESVEFETVARIRDEIDTWDVSGLLADVRCPTLILHRNRYEFPSMEASRTLAAGIPNATMDVIDGSSPAVFMGNTDLVVQKLSQFLGAPFETPSRSAHEHSGSLTILFTDMLGSTAMTQRSGDEGAQDVLREHNRVVRAALAAHGGSEVKHTGDGIMASFLSASSAVMAAVDMQKAFAAHNEREGAEHLGVRIGLNAGEPVSEEGDLFGTAVQLAARICAQAEPGQVLVSNVVRELTAGRSFLFADAGEASLKGFDAPVQVYAVHW